MKAWSEFLESQERSLGKEVVDKWLRSLCVTHFDAANLYLSAKDPFHLQWVEEHVRKKLKEGLLSSNGKPIKVHLTLEGSSFIKPHKKQPSSLPIPVFQKEPLDPNLQFQNLILCDENAPLFSFFTELLSGQVPLGTFNPIYIWGKGGCGKTHLLMALASHFEKRGIKTLYAKQDLFTEHVIQAIRTSSMHSFRSFYRTAEVLIIDDVDQLSSKFATQEEFFHTFNALHSQKKQVILSAKTPPSELSCIEPRLISRFEWGISFHLHPLSHLHLAHILDKKLEELSLALSDEIKQFLLNHFPTLTALQKGIDLLLLREHIDRISIAHLTLQECEILLQSLLKEQKTKALSPEKIQKVVCKVYGISESDLLGKSQTKECSFPRKIAIYLCRKNLKLSFQKIGHLFFRDHSTIMTSVKDIENALENKEEGLLACLHEIQRQLAD